MVPVHSTLSTPRGLGSLLGLWPKMEIDMLAVLGEHPGGKETEPGRMTQGARCGEGVRGLTSVLGRAVRCIGWFSVAPASE